MTQIDTETIIKAMEGLWINAVGIRYSDDEYTPGTELKPSHDWDGEHDISSDELLPGTSAVYVGTKIDDDLGIDTPDDWIDLKDEEEYKAFTEMVAAKGKTYGKKHAYLVAGQDAGWGEDEGEIIIKYCTVLMEVY